MDRNTMMVAVTGQLMGGMILITLLTLWFRRKRDVPIAATEGLRRIEARLTEMQHALDTVAVEVERISEAQRFTTRSEEHTSELQSPYDLVCRLLLETKKHTTTTR